MVDVGESLSYTLLEITHAASLLVRHFCQQHLVFQHPHVLLYNLMEQADINMISSDFCTDRRQRVIESLKRNRLLGCAGVSIECIQLKMHKGVVG